MRDITNVEIVILLKELSAFENKRLENIYDIDESAFRFRINKKDLIVSLNPKAIYITKYEFPSKESPSFFVSLLRKNLKGKFIRKIHQKGLDRILIFDFDDFQLIFELFSKGNVVLTDKKNVTIVTYRQEEWKDRKIKPKEPYFFPKSTKIEISEINAEKIFSLQNENYPIINVLSSNINIGSFYMEKILEKAKIDKNKTKITEEEAEKIANTINEFNKLLKGEKSDFELKPCFSSDYSFLEIEGGTPTISLSDAIDSILTPILQKNKKEEEKTQKIKAKLEIQEKLLQELLKNEKEAREKADFIYSHISEIEFLLKNENKMGEIKIGSELIKWKKDGKKLILEA